MDLGTAQQMVGTPAHCVDGHVLCWPGAFLPQIVPLACLAPQVRAAALNASSEAPLGARVKAYLDAGQTDLAWAQLAHLTEPLSVPLGVDTALQLWSARTLADLGLVASDRSPVVIDGPRDLAPEEQHRLQTEATAGLAAVQGVLPVWPWPRWIGQVVIVTGDRVIDGLPASSRLLPRPALPAIRVHDHAARSDMARELSFLTLSLSAPPRAGWPAWLSIGLAEIAAAKADDVLISPAHMQQVRQAAGPTGLSDVLQSLEPDPQLSEAVVALLLHPSHRANLASFLDLLRNGAGAEGALHVAFNLSVQDLAQGR